MTLHEHEFARRFEELERAVREDARTALAAAALDHEVEADVPTPVQAREMAKASQAKAADDLKRVRAGITRLFAEVVVHYVDGRIELEPKLHPEVAEHGTIRLDLAATSISHSPRPS